jgi:hypothetical protein
LKKLLLFSLLNWIPLMLISQVVYQDLTNQGIYTFIDELANLKVISLNSVIKPYPRSFIAQKLKEASEKKEKLNRRQQKELAFYLRDFNLELQPSLSYIDKQSFFKNRKELRLPFNPLALLYKDSLFTFSLRPVLGISYVANENGSAYHRWNGAEIFGYIGRHFGFYASLRDNHEDQITVLPQYLTGEEGAAWKGSSKGGGDYSEMRGGMTWQWKWGDVAFVKDHSQWGDHYNGSNIVSGRTPSYPYLQYHMKPAPWLEFTYQHAWLVSEVTDTTKSYPIPGGVREVYFNKYYAASMFTITPAGNLNISIGNSVIYCSEYMNPAYLSPFLFYFNFGYADGSGKSPFYGKEVQTFLNVSSRNIRHLHLYANLFLNQYTPTGLSWKAGFRLSGFPLQNLSLTGEYTQNNGTAYASGLTTTTYESNRYNMGHYLRSDAAEIFVALSFKPIRGLNVDASYLYATHGDETELNSPDYTNQAISATVRYEVIGNAYVFVTYQRRQTTGDVKYTPEIYQGQTNNLVTGINIGF